MLFLLFKETIKWLSNKKNYLVESCVLLSDNNFPVKYIISRNISRIKECLIINSTVWNIWVYVHFYDTFKNDEIDRNEIQHSTQKL